MNLSINYEWSREILKLGDSFTASLGTEQSVASVFHIRDGMEEREWMRNERRTSEVILINWLKAIYSEAAHLNPFIK